MPRCVFRLLWDTLFDGREIFAYVKNMAKNGDHYWVFAHVTPTFDSNGQVVAYHSNRRLPERREVDLFAGIYAQLLQEEQRHTHWREGMDAAIQMLVKTLADKGVSYDEFVLSV